MYKLPIEFAYGNLTAKVSKRNRHGEYVVKFYENGNHLKDADYFDTEKDDAINIAKYSLKSMYEKRVNEGSTNFDQQLDKKYNNKSDKEWDDQVIIKVIDSYGKIKYYTGRVGERWLSSNPDEAFTGYNEIGVKNWIERNKNLGEINRVRFEPTTLREAKLRHKNLNFKKDLIDIIQEIDSSGSNFHKAIAAAWTFGSRSEKLKIESVFEDVFNKYR